MGISEWRNEATPERATVGVCFDRRLLSELEEAEKELQEAEAKKDSKMLGTAGAVAALEKRVESLRKGAQEKTRTLVFECIGRTAWSDLKDEHPPTEKQKAENEGLDLNPNTFYAAAIAASCVEPGMSVEEAAWMLDVLPEGVCVRITTVLTKVNYFGSRDPFADGFGGASPSAPKSKQA